MFIWDGLVWAEENGGMCFFMSLFYKNGYAITVLLFVQGSAVFYCFWTFFLSLEVLSNKHRDSHSPTEPCGLIQDGLSGQLYSWWSYSGELSTCTLKPMPLPSLAQLRNSPTVPNHQQHKRETWRRSVRLTTTEGRRYRESARGWGIMKSWGKRVLRSHT